MPGRVIGIDPGTVSVDLCGLDDGRVFLDRSLPTAEALADPSVITGILAAAAPLDLVTGPSGYGLPLVKARDVTDAELRLAYLAPEGESGGIGGLRSLMRTLAAGSAPVVLTPGVLHLPSVPAYRKVNRVDMGTADKLCAAILAMHDQMTRRACQPGDVSLIVIELGRAFTAAIAVDHGRIVDGIGGTSGPIGLRSSGAFDGEVAFLAGSVSKSLLFRGGANDVAGVAAMPLGEASLAEGSRARMAMDAYLESAVKAVAALCVSVPDLKEIVLSGRFPAVPRVLDRLHAMLAIVAPRAAVRRLTGFAAVASQAAQGAALLADGLAGGASAPLVDALGIRAATGTVLDHLYVISPAAARARLGIAEPKPRT